MDFFVIIRCPRTDDEVPTGLITDITKLDNLPSNPTELKCSACGERHQWSRRDAFLAHSISDLDSWRPQNEYFSQPRLRTAPHEKSGAPQGT
jgi:hypothetical protein